MLPPKLVGNYNPHLLALKTTGQHVHNSGKKPISSISLSINPMKPLYLSLFQAPEIDYMLSP